MLPLTGLDIDPHALSLRISSAGDDIFDVAYARAKQVSLQPFREEEALKGTV